eukprot:scaffold2318_cov363-Pavlova_lutheri.AAC.9
MGGKGITDTPGQQANGKGSSNEDVQPPPSNQAWETVEQPIREWVHKDPVMNRGPGPWFVQGVTRRGKV